MTEWVQSRGIKSMVYVMSINIAQHRRPSAPPPVPMPVCTVTGDDEGVESVQITGLMWLSLELV